MVSDKKIFKVFYIAIKPYTLMAIFFFFFFFWWIMTAWTNLVEGNQRNIPAKLNGPTVSYEKIFKFFYIDI